MKFDGSRTMHEHVIEMTNITTRPKTFEWLWNVGKISKQLENGTLESYKESNITRTKWENVRY
ncbi:hypothetical protein CR513_46184, partial [Mucuna pruriens]